MNEKEGKGACKPLGKVEEGGLTLSWRGGGLCGVPVPRTEDLEKVSRLSPTEDE